jgi:hypothetical protein
MHAWTRTVGAEDAVCLARKKDAVFVLETKIENLLNAIKEAKKKGSHVARWC